MRNNVPRKQNTFYANIRYLTFVIFNMRFTYLYLIYTYLYLMSYLKKSSRMIFSPCLHGKNNFIEVSKNLVRYRSENNFVEASK